MKLWKSIAALALLVMTVNHCDLGTPPQANGGGTEVEGIIVDQHGSPAANVWVRVYPDSSTVLGKRSGSTEAFLAIRDSAKTQSNGSFTLPNLPSGTYNLVATVRRNDTTLSLFRRSVVVSGNLNLGTDTLRVAGMLSLNIALQGSAISGAQCYIPGSPYIALSDLAGLCTLTGLPPGIYTIKVSVNGLPSGQTGQIAVISLQVTSAGTINLTWVNLPPGTTPDSTWQWIDSTGTTAPATPTLLAPSNGSIVDSAKVRWSKVAGAATYHLQVSTDSSFVTMLVNDSARTDTSRMFVGMGGLKYYWRVRARNAAGVSAWAPAWTFTMWSATTCPMVANNAPTLIFPANLATGVGTSVTLAWDAVCGAAAYRVQVTTDSLFTSGFSVNDSAVPTTSRAVSLAGATSYYWRVSARTQPNSWSLWSAARRFTTGTTVDTGTGGLVAPSLLTPSAGATGVTMPPSFTWSTVSGATLYRIQLARDSLFLNLIADSTGTSPSKVLGGIPTIQASTLYYWRVRAQSGANYSAYSATRFFTTKGSGDSTLAAPVLASPAAFAAGVSVSPTLSWNAVSGATKYLIEVSNNANFATLLKSDSTTATNLSLTGLSASTQHYWRVLAKSIVVNGATTTTSLSAYSAIRSFTTEEASVPGWTARTSFVTNALYAIAFKPDSLMVAVGAAGTILTSSNGTTWLTRTSGVTVGLNGVTWGNNRYVAVGAGGVVLTSTDGIAWTQRTTSVTVDLNAVIRDSNNFIAVGNSGTVLYSPDGTTWSSQASGTTSNLHSISKGGSKLIVTGAGGVILTSPSAAAPGSAWTLRTSSTTNNLYAAAWTGSQFIVAGANGTISTSVDGIAWTLRVPGTTSTLYALASSGTTKAAGTTGALLGSTDGTVWTTETTGTTAALYALTKFKTLWVAAGANGTILTSP